MLDSQHAHSENLQHLGPPIEARYYAPPAELPPGGVVAAPPVVVAAPPVEIGLPEMPPMPPDPSLVPSWAGRGPMPPPFPGMNLPAGAPKHTLSLFEPQFGYEAPPAGGVEAVCDEVADDVESSNSSFADDFFSEPADDEEQSGRVKIESDEQAEDPPAAKRRKVDTAEEEISVDDLCRQIRKETEEAARDQEQSPLLLQAKELHGELLQEWLVVLCPELWSLYDQNTPLELYQNNLRLVQGSPAVEIQSKIDSKEDAARRDRRKEWLKWAESFEKNPVFTWWADPPRAEALPMNDFRIVGCLRYSRIVSRNLRPLPATLRAKLRRAYNKRKKNVLAVSLQLRIPPRVLLRHVFQANGLPCNRETWESPSTLSKRDEEQLRACKRGDTITCEELMWASMEKLHMVEKAIAKWCKIIGARCIARENMPSQVLPRPSLVASPCIVRDRRVHWFEVWLLYGLASGPLFDVVVQRISALVTRHGIGCLLLPNGFDAGFPEALERAVQASVVVLDPVDLDPRLSFIHDILDKSLFELRGNFDRMLSAWAAPYSSSVQVELISPVKPAAARKPAEAAAAPATPAAAAAPKPNQAPPEPPAAESSPKPPPETASPAQAPAAAPAKLVRGKRVPGMKKSFTKKW